MAGGYGAKVGVVGVDVVVGDSDARVGVGVDNDTDLFRHWVGFLYPIRGA